MRILKKKIKIIFKTIVRFHNEIRLKIYNFLKQYFPFNYICKFYEMRLEHHQRETEIFVANMPNWYKIYELNFWSRFLRFFSLNWFVFQLPLNQQRIQLFVEIFLQNTYDWTTYHNIVFCITLMFLLNWFFYFFLRFILGFIFIKKIIYNSPISGKRTVNFFFSRGTALAGIIGLGVGFGTTTVDSQLIRVGYKPLVQGKIDHCLYATTGLIPKKLGSEPYADYDYFKDEDLGGLGQYFKKIQESDNERYVTLKQVYENRLHAEEFRKLSREIESKIEKDK